MSDQYAPIWKELPLPSEEDRRLFEEWAKKQKEKEQEEQEGSDNRVIIIEL